MFATKLLKAGYSQELLKQLIEEIDAEKSSVRSALSQLSSEPDEKSVKGRERQTRIRRMKDKISFLTGEREQVRARLGQIKTDLKALNKLQHSPKNKKEFSQAFMVAAELYLSEEVYLDLEVRAAQIIESL
jgi:chromosome segregation ATPase